MHENWNKDLRLFSDEDDGGQQLLQVFTAVLFYPYVFPLIISMKIIEDLMEFVMVLFAAVYIASRS